MTTDRQGYYLIYEPEKKDWMDKCEIFFAKTKPEIYNHINKMKITSTNIIKIIRGKALDLKIQETIKIK